MREPIRPGPGAMTIPFVDLRAQYAAIRDELDEAVLRVVASGRYTLGPEVDAFEREFAVYCSVREAVAVNSGTSALHLALLACGVGPGDEVVTVPFTFVATVAAILYTGAKPVLVDVEPETLTMDANALDRAITSRTKAVIPVHLYGHPADMDPILRVAEARSVSVIEDAAQAHGAQYKGRRAGGIGHIGCFSFYPTKNLGACGEGGIAVTNDDTTARRMRAMRDWGQESKGFFTFPGFNYRMSAFQGAALRVKLAHLDEWTRARRAFAQRYEELLPQDKLTLPAERPDCHHVYHQYTVRSGSRDRLKESLAAAGVHTAVYYASPLHLQPGYNRLGYDRGDFPVSERASTEVLSLPLYPEMRPDQVEAVARHVVANA